MKPGHRTCRECRHTKRRGKLLRSSLGVECPEGAVPIWTDFGGGNESSAAIQREEDLIDINCARVFCQSGARTTARAVGRAKKRSKGKKVDMGDMHYKDGCVYFYNTGKHRKVDPKGRVWVRLGSREWAYLGRLTFPRRYRKYVRNPGLP